MEEKIEYPFLKVKKIKQVVSYYLNDKITHSVYKAVLAESTLKNAKRHGLFQIDKKHPDLSEVEPSDLTFHLKRLIEDVLVTQLCYFVFDPDSRKLLLKTCYIAYPENEMEGADRLFLELLDGSGSAILEFLKDRSQFPIPELKKELEADLSAKEPLSSKEVRWSAVDIFSGLHIKENFPLPPHPELIQTFQSELEQDLKAKSMIFENPPYGYVNAENASLLQKFEIAVEFMEKRVFPKFRWLLTDSFDLIQLESEEYYSDSHALPTTKFQKQKAVRIDNLMKSSSENYLPKYDWFPGKLCIGIVLALADAVDEEYKTKHQKSVTDRFHEIKNKVSKKGQIWTEMILFFSEKDYESLPPEARQKLQSDPELLFSVWQTREQTVHAVALKNVDTMKEIIHGMQLHPPHEPWKTPCIKNMIEENEANLPDLFKDQSFIKLYGQVLRRGYVSYFPWYYNLLELVGLASVFQDHFFAQAKVKIRDEQSLYKARHDEKKSKDEKRRSLAKVKRKEDIEKQQEKLEVAHALSRFYFKERKIPTVEDLENSLSHWKPEAKSRLVSQFGLMIIPWKFRNTEERLVFFPQDQGWQSRARQVYEWQKQNIQRLQNKSTNLVEEVELDKSNRLLRFLDSKLQKQPNSKAVPELKPEESDPYEALEREIEKSKKAEKAQSTLKKSPESIGSNLDTGQL